MIDISLITEAFNLDEGQSLTALQGTLRFLDATHNAADTEILIAVTSPDNPALRDLLGAYPSIRVVDCRGLGYDQAKMKVASAASGTTLAFLDGDCVPRDATWRDRLTTPLHREGVECVSGLTIYHGGLFAKMCSVLDFGFLYEILDGELVGCYVSNNFAIRKDHLLRNPIPDSNLRCNCYHHAQLMMEQGTPFILAAGAVALHETPSFFKERWRRGFDFILETHANCRLPRARSSQSLLWSAFRIYRDNLILDWTRLPASRSILGLSAIEARLAAICFPLLRLVDLCAIVAALHEDDRRQRLGTGSLS